MTDSLYKIVFNGEVMPEADINAVKDNLARLFKSDRSKIDGLFTGGSVALKRDLTEADADKYLDALQSAGAKVYKEIDLSSGLSLVETDDHRTTPVVPAEASTHMTCPKCGHEQATAVECSACGIVIDKYLARQAQLAEEAAANPAPAPAAATSSLTATLAAADARASSPYATPRAQVADALPEYGELNYFSIEGRIGRVRYLGWSMAMTLLALPVLGILMGLSVLSPIIGGLMVMVASIGMMVLSVFIGAKRLHDLGWSAWMWLLLIIPVIGTVFALIMLFAPGNSGANRYGAPPPPNSKGVVVLAWSILAIPVLLGILAAIALPAYQNYVSRSQQSEYSQPSEESGESAEPAAEAADPGMSEEESEQSEE